MISRPLIILALALSLSGCDPFQLDHSIKVLEGRADPAPAAQSLGYLVIPPSSSEEVAVAVEPYVPEPVVCENYMWRFMLYTCDGTLIGPDPRYE